MEGVLQDRAGDYRRGDYATGFELTSLATLENVTKIFRGRRGPRRVWRRGPDVTALEGITLGVESGEIVSIAGANGSGKTTLLRLLARVLLPTSGRFQAPTGRLIYIPGGERQLQERLTGFENLRFLARLAGDDPELIRAACARTGLEARVVDEPVWTYTTGMRMRLILARAFVGRAGLVLLDEPTRFLDLAGREGVRREFARLRDEGVAIVAATHDLEWIAGSDRTIALERGRVAAAGKVTDLDGARRLLERAGAASLPDTAATPSRPRPRGITP